MEPSSINKRAHANATLLATECFSVQHSREFFLNVCDYIEKNTEDLQRMGPHLYTYQECEIFVSHNKKLYVLTRGREFHIGSGERKTFFKGLDYFKGKIIAHSHFNLIPIEMEKEFKVETLAEYRKVRNNLIYEISTIQILNKRPPETKMPRGTVKLLHAFESKKKIISIFKYYQSGTLTNVLRSQLPPNTQKLKMAYDLIEGLAHLHASNIAHCDIKEDNILVNVKAAQPNMKSIQTVLCDLNLSIERLPLDTHKDFPFSYPAGGSPFYYSPEKIEAMVTEKFVTELSFEKAKQSDVWALGCVLYKLFICASPWLRELKRKKGKKKEEDQYTISAACYPPWFVTLDKLYRNNPDSFFENKSRSAKKVRKAVTLKFPEPKNKNSIEYLIWLMVRPNYEERITSEKLLLRIKELIPLLTSSNDYSIYGSSETIDSEEDSLSSMSSIRDTPNLFHFLPKRTKSFPSFSSFSE